MKASHPTADSRSGRRAIRRLEREAATVRVMIDLFCRGHHERTSGLCGECEALWSYVQQRLGRCPFRADKPTCLSCTVHCFKPAMREQIRHVMRYAGPRMAWRHPILSVHHFLDGRRPPRPRASGETP